jgi:mycothiol synthase
MKELSSRFRGREATREDAEGILAVGIARDIADVGYPDYALDDVLEELAEAGYARVVTDESARVVASGLLTHADARIAVHPDACGQGIGTWLRERVEEQLGEGTIRQYVAGSNDPARRLLLDAGYTTEQHYFRMVRDLDGELAEVPWPDGVEVRGYEPGPDDRAAHALIQDAFTEIPGNVERAFDDWRARSVGGAQFAPGLSAVAFDGDRLAGVVLANRWDDGQGYVSHLATARDRRGRGLGRALLAAALAKMRDGGLARAALDVNGSNESATRLYESVGLRVGSRAERYDKELSRRAAA